MEASKTIFAMTAPSARESAALVFASWGDTGVTDFFSHFGGWLDDTLPESLKQLTEVEREQTLPTIKVFQSTFEIGMRLQGNICDLIWFF